MNLNAVLDVTAQRTPSPLDRSVSDDSGDGAFADVMSQYGPNGAGKPTTDAQTGAAAPAKPSAEAGPPAADAAAATTAAQNDGTATPPQPKPTGAMLPPDAPASGQPLPLDPAVDLGAVLDARGAPKPVDDSTDDAENGANDPTAAAIVAALAVPGAPTQVANATTPVVADAELMPNVVAKPANGAATDAPDPTSLPASSDAADPTPLDPTAFERIRAQLDRLQRSDDTIPTNEPRRTVVPLGRATAAVAAAAPRLSESAAQTLRTLLRGKDDTTQPLTAARGRDARAIADSSIAKPIATQLAATVDAVIHKDTPVGSDTADAPVRVDATQGRTGGADTARDAAPARLPDLAQQHAPRFTGELADRVLVMRNQRLDGATVTLEPRDLGRIDIQVRLQADTTHVTFTAQHAAVRDALEGQLPRLRSMLEEAGLSLGAVDVAHAGARNATGGDAGTARYEAPRADSIDAETTDASTPWRPRASTSLIDLHA